MIELDLVGNLRDLNILSVAVRLLLAMLFGGTIGFERGIRHRAAGLRTHMLLSVGAASTMMVSQFLYASYDVGDPARLSAQVISGIGFLGAGTVIITRHNEIKGLTTAASVWATACMGLAVGVGFYECAIIMYILLIIILLLMNVLDNRFLKIATTASFGRQAWGTPCTLSMSWAGGSGRSGNCPLAVRMCWRCRLTWIQTTPCLMTSTPWSCSGSKPVCCA